MAAPAPAAADCSAAGLSATISSVMKATSDYLAKHPDVNQALLDATRQPAFVALGQMDGFFKDHPQEADEVRAIQQPARDYQNRCGLVVEPAEAFMALQGV
jgi:hemophore-related protein